MLKKDKKVLAAKERKKLVHTLLYLIYINN